MKALVWHGKEDIRCDTVTDPKIEDERDAIVKVTSCAICGSDLHLFHNFIPAMLPGDIICSAEDDLCLPSGGRALHTRRV